MKYPDQKHKGKKMPNWIYNRLVVHTTHPELKSKLGALADAKTQSPLNQDQAFFSLFFPRPENVEDWYTWSIANWGTKWDVDADVTRTESKNDADGFLILFNSAWDAPKEFLFQLADRFNQDGHHTEIELHFFCLEEAVCGYMTTTPDITQLVSEQPERVKNAEIGWIGGMYDAVTIRDTDPEIAARFEEVFRGFLDLFTNLGVE